MGSRESLNPSRLTLARERRGLTKVGLALAVELAPRTITQYERGAQEPRPETIRKIANALDFPDAFFTRDDPDGPSIEAASFRAKSRMSARVRDQVLGFAAIAMDLSHWIDHRFITPRPDVPQFRNVAPSLAAASLRREWGLGEAPLPHTIDLVESHGVRVFSLPHELDKVDANSFWQDDRPFILLNRSKSAERSRFDIAHELGHLTMHDGHSAHGKLAEAQANDFASAFMMPEADVVAHAPANPTLTSLTSIKRRWGVSLSALVRRLYKLGLLSEWQYRDLFINISRRGYRTSEPAGLPIERSQAIDNILSACAQVRISLQDIARELAMPSNDLNAMMFGLELLAGQQSEITSHADSAMYSLRVVK